MKTPETLATREPSVFQELVIEYCRLIELNLDCRTFDQQGEPPLVDCLPAFAEKLGELRAGPRDLVEIHGKCLGKNSSADNPHLFMAMAEEGRLLLLELMGYLSGYYRKLALRMEEELRHIKKNGDQVQA